MPLCDTSSTSNYQGFLSFIFSWFENYLGVLEAVKSSNMKTSILFPKPPPTGKLPQAHSIPLKITQKGLSYSERDTCKTLSRADQAADAAAAALEEALSGQVEI